MRKATSKLYEMAKDLYASERGQDIIETSIKAAVAAGGMEALTDMSSEEILLASLIGASGAMAARPLGKRLGQRVGKAIDQRVAPENPDEMMRTMRDWLNKQAAKDNVYAREGADFLRRRFTQNYSRPDGSMAGDMEGTMGELFRESADDVTQLGLAVALPGLFDRMPEEDL